MRSCWIVLASTLSLFAQEGTWPFDPAKDPFTPDALLDLRYLNETYAGQHGFIRANPQGDFTHGEGSIIRFWGVNSSVGRHQPYLVRPLWQPGEPSLETHARFLAKRGVNLVRLRAHLNPDVRSPQAALTSINAQERDWIWRAVAAYKKEGIYTVISPYWAEQMRIHPSWQLPGGPQDAHTLLFFDETLQAAYRAWLRALYDPVNPYTGTRLADEPAVALLQLQNEDSLFHWTTDRLRGPQRQNLGRRFYTWAVARHGSWAKANEHWEGTEVPGDAPAAGLLNFFDIYRIGFEENGGYGKRLADQTRFWVDTMRSFNTTMVQFLRQDLGCRQLINAGNGKTSNLEHLEDLERYADSAADVLAVNRSFDSIHFGRNVSFAIVDGDNYVTPSVLQSPHLLPLNIRQVRGYPLLVTEGNWVPPLRYAAEAPFLIAAYQSLGGIDGYLWYGEGTGDEFAPPQSANGYMTSLAKWTYNTPDILGMFPAAAFLYRKGFLRQGDPILTESRSLDELFERRTPMLPEGPPTPTAMNPAAFLIGPVEFVPGGRPAGTTQINIRPLIDGPRVKSVTGQLLFDREKAICTIDSPRAQGVAGFFSAQNEFRFTDVTLTARHDYGAITVIALDEVPLRQSHRVLVQVGTRTRPEGWSEQPLDIPLDADVLPGWHINSIGKAPWRVATANLDVEIRNPSLTTAYALDANGYALAEVPLTATAGGVRFSFPSGTLYVVLQ